MPTAKPRITITLNEHQHHLLQTLSALQSQSMSAIVVDLLESVTPVLERLAVVLKSAKDAPESVRQELKRSAESAEAQFLPMAQEMMGQLDMLVGVGAGGAAVRSAAVPPVPTSGAGKGRPPPTNRGVRKSPNIAKSPMKSTTSPRSGKVGPK